MDSRGAGTHRYHFNSHIFQNELAYAEEGLNISKISFQGNMGCLDLIEKILTGILVRSTHLRMFITRKSWYWGVCGVKVS